MDEHIKELYINLSLISYNYNKWTEFICIIVLCVVFGECC